MARHSFGGDAAAYVVAPGPSETFGSITGNRTLLVPGKSVSFWTASSGGIQITDLLDAIGTPAMTITTGANGDIAQFSGPNDGTRAMWADASGGAGPRVLMVANDLGADLTAAESGIAAIRARATTLYAYDYGYRPGGAASTNTTAINNALAALGTAGGEVVLPPGYGLITAPGITLPSRCGLRGAGHYATVLSLDNASNCHMIQNHVSTDGAADPNTMFCEIRDLGLDGRGASQTGAGPYYGIYFTTNPVGNPATSDLSHDATHLIENVYIRNTFSDGIYSYGRADNRIVNCKVSFAGGNAFTVGFDSHVIGCVAEKPGLAGFNIIGSNCMLVNCKAYATGQTSSTNGQVGVPNSGHGYVVTGGSFGEVQIVNCDAQQVSGHGFSILAGNYGTAISGCTVGGPSYLNGTTFVGYNLENCKNNIVQGTCLVQTGGSSLRLVSGADQNSINITHAPLTGQAPAGTALSSDTVILTNGIIINGAQSTSALKDANGNTILGLSPQANAVNYLTVANSATGTAIVLTPGGADVNASLWIAPRGGSPITLADNFGRHILDVQTPVGAGAGNWLKATNNLSGSAPQLSAIGTDANVNLQLVPKGTGSVDASSAKVTSVAIGTAVTDAATFGQLLIVPWSATTVYAKGQMLTYLGFVYQASSAFTSGATFSTANLTMISAPIAGTVIPPSKYVFAGGGQITGTSNALGINALCVFPFYLPHGATLTRIGAEVVTVGDVGSKFRLGVYADTGSFTPGALVVDAGQIAGDSATVQELTISQASTPGVYWVGGAVQVVTTNQPTMRTITPGPFALPSASAPLAGAVAAGWGHTSAVAGALPATFVPGASPVGSVPRIHLKG